jgi:hypothetical protein
MSNSLFQKDNQEESSAPRSPYDLIGKEIGHLKKGSSVRHGNNLQKSSLPWLVVMLVCAAVGLYVMDPVIHAWDKGTAVRVYLYLHTFGSGPDAAKLIATGIFSADEIDALNRRTGSFQDYFSSPEAANLQAEDIIKYMANVKLLHAGKYEQLDPVGRARYLLFIRTGIFLPTSWSFLDPAVTG